jgi:hypothetical protein
MLDSQQGSGSNPEGPGARVQQERLLHRASPQRDDLQQRDPANLLQNKQIHFGISGLFELV